MCNVVYISSSLCSLYCSNALFGADIGGTGHLFLSNMLGNSSVGELPLGHLLVVLGQVQCLTYTGHDSIGSQYSWRTSALHMMGAEGVRCSAHMHTATQLNYQAPIPMACTIQPGNPVSKPSTASSSGVLTFHQGREQGKLRRLPLPRGQLDSNGLELLTQDMTSILGLGSGWERGV